jgi:hypothetical protein
MVILIIANDLIISHNLIIVEMAVAKSIDKKPYDEKHYRLKFAAK